MMRLALSFLIACAGCNKSVEVPPGCPQPEDAGVSYVSHQPSECATIRFTCPTGAVAFSDDICGCGCVAPN